MTFVTAMRLIVLAAIAAFGGGFAWGVADHRGIAAVADFADQHIVFPKPDREALLVFGCDSSQPLVAYNLLNDEVLTKQQEIKARLASPVNLVFQNNLFSHYTAFGAGVFGTMFSLTDELRRWKARESTKWTIALLGAVVIPTSYLGYLASNWFRLECGSKSIYERLADKRLWGPHRLDAARAMFDQLAYCIDRRVTLPAEQESSASSAPDAPGGSESPEDQRGRARASPQERQKAIDDWRAYISAANTDLPQQSAVESRYREREVVPGREKPKAQPTWGDSFYQRIYGDEGFVAADADFDKADFQLIFALERRCGQLDREAAKTLYAKVYESSEPAATSVATKDQEDFFTRRAEVSRAMLKSM
jgi:hypothetical protein